MIKPEIQPLHPDFGARILGVTLSGNMAGDTLDFIRQSFEQYSLLCFPEQDLDDEKQLAFTRLLGTPEAEHVRFGQTGEISYFGTVGNIRDDGTSADPANARYQSGNQLWHSDSSFREVPSSFSILHAYEVPQEGGDTEFASMRAGYARLPEALRQRIEPLHVIHDYVFSRSPVAPVNPNHAASLPPVMHPMVRTNPTHGLKNYYVGSHARSIVGLSGIESRQLLDELLEHTTEPDHVLRHAWCPGETVIWDNRCLLHKGSGYDADRWRRRLRQTRVVGDEKGVIHQTPA
ncbi:MAG TPA: TauD/TfdA family dioxygenase [Arenicellales bacterium]|jgi:alpha-ketoglutarate-dependent 2,4-dichlorophenoxyacetate dioxygenase|nr:TauD/TfdA family dioxygenase [Arenicellales bacterium]|tara:strand:+ start:2346 stop:3215 length:870 start_codon:yes stop_codon:yes gene_type:complete